MITQVKRIINLDITSTGICIFKITKSQKIWQH